MPTEKEIVQMSRQQGIAGGPVRATSGKESPSRKFAKKSTYVLGLSSMALMGGLVVAPGQAYADDSRCPANRFCLFQHSDFHGGRAVFNRDDGNLGDNVYDNGRRVEDSASSMINNTGLDIRLFSGRGRRGAKAYTARAESVDSTFGNNGFNDVASSLDFRE